MVLISTIELNARIKYELEVARFQHREKDLQTTARHAIKRAEKAEVRNDKSDTCLIQVVQ